MIYNNRFIRLLPFNIIIIYNIKSFKRFNNLIINKSKKILIYNKIKEFIIRINL